MKAKINEMCENPKQKVTNTVWVNEFMYYYGKHYVIGLEM